MGIFSNSLTNNNHLTEEFYSDINEELVIIEGSSSERKYKCPFCEYRATKIDLLKHIEKNHKEMIPMNYTAARVLFNYFNKKDHGTCVQCGNETDWNEETMRYERFCKNPKCKKAYSDNFHKVRMVNKYGKENLLNDPEMQKKMLASRSISGGYKFQDGGIKTYTGSYEKKLLEFFDKVMNVKSSDIDTPGPIFKYEYKGKELTWITDVYYAPANLVIEVKDGGSNPNNRSMVEYREKQISKEDMIKKNGKYNYIRLTNNNFLQLMEVLTDIKYQLMNNPESVVIHINESLEESAINNKNDKAMTENAAANAIPNLNKAYIIQYRVPANSTFADDKDYIGLSTDITDRMFRLDDEGNLIEENFAMFMLDKTYNVYAIKEFKEEILNEENPIKFIIESTYISESGSFIQNGNLFLSKLDSNAYDRMYYHRVIEEATINTLSNHCIPSLTQFRTCDGIENCRIFEDEDGIFARHIITANRTPSFESITKLYENMNMIKYLDYKF